MRVLHVAPEKNLGSWLSRQHGIEYVSADLTAPNVMVKMDLTDICCPGDFFDAIICNHVLEHISDDAKAMTELYRVLKPSGWAILQVPISRNLSATYEDASIIDPEDRAQAFGQSDHVRIYGVDYVDRLKRAGFDVELFQWAKHVEQFGSAQNRYALIKEEVVFRASKLQG